MKVLVWTNKYGGELYDASTPEAELAAYKAVFEEMDGDDFYIDIEEAGEPITCEPCQKQLHRHCEKGNCICTEAECKRKVGRLSREQEMARMFKAAKSGNLQAIKEFVMKRSKEGYEYEAVEIKQVQKAK